MRNSSRSFRREKEKGEDQEAMEIISTHLDVNFEVTECKDL